MTQCMQLYIYLKKYTINKSPKC